MKNIMELLYSEELNGWRSGTHAPDSEFVRTARIKSENLELLMSGLDASQKDWFDAYSEADGRIESMMHYDNFCYAFHLGAQLMAELIRGKEELLE